jgi:hypothetical protein
MESKVAYDVAVEEGGLNWEKAGPLFDRYAVNLNGRIDRRWVDCYQKITVSTPSYSRFRLEPGTSTVTFTCRSTDGPVEVMAVVKRLEDLLQRVNREAATDLAARPVESVPAARPPAPGGTGQAGGAQRPTSIAAGLLARLTRH